MIFPFIILASLEVVTAQLYGSTYFSSELYGTIPKEDKSLVFSPLSVRTLLTLLYQGASGETADILRESLKAAYSTKLAKQYKRLIHKLNNQKHVSLNLANKICVGEGTNLAKAFRRVALRNYFADVETVDFHKINKTIKVINKWVKEITHGHIDKIVSKADIGTHTNVISLSAVYFKGHWEYAFDKKLTKMGKFYNAMGQTENCKMMTVAKSFDIITDFEHAKFVKINYISDSFSMIIGLPKDEVEISDLERELDNYDLNSFFNEEEWTLTNIVLQIPKFTIESTIDLKMPLIDIGMSDIFLDNASFPNILAKSRNFKINKIIQKAFIEVDEEGSESSGAVDISRRVPPMRFRVDHPFIYYIVVNLGRSIVILFMGRYMSSKY